MRSAPSDVITAPSPGPHHTAPPSRQSRALSNRGLLDTGSSFVAEFALDVRAMELGHLVKFSPVVISHTLHFPTVRRTGVPIVPSHAPGKVPNEIVSVRRP